MTIYTYFFKTGPKSSHSARYHCKGQIKFNVIQDTGVHDIQFAFLMAMLTRNYPFTSHTISIVLEMQSSCVRQQLLFYTR